MSVKIADNANGNVTGNLPVSYYRRLAYAIVL